MYRFFPGVEHVTRLNLILCNMTLPGWAVLFERGSRRRELANYCLTHALYSYWNWLKRAQGVKPRSWVSILVLAASFSVLVQNPNGLTSHVLAISKQKLAVK